MYQKRKTRILLNNEASFLATGYSVIGYELMSRWAATGKYELAELASYGQPNDPRQGALRWKYYPNMPRYGDQEQFNIYNSNILFQFGKWKWEQTCLDFLPDIVISFTDPWMCEHLVSSAYRPYYAPALLIPCDSSPMENAWVDSYMSCDKIFTYTDWGAEQYKKQSGNHSNFGGTISPGVDFNTFKPVLDKEKHKATFGLPPDSIIIGTVMRNQKRKLYPDLIESFDNLIQAAPNHLKSKIYLYLHTAIPDIGWDIPNIIKNSKNADKILITYICLNCKNVFCSPCHGARTTCKKCGQKVAITPSTQTSLSREGLASIINLFDVYVQYANKEGLGMPAIEAASCGIHVLATNYSGMVDVIKKTGGTPIDVKRFIWESETHSRQAYPDNDDLVKKLLGHITAPDHIKVKKSIEARKGVVKYFSWEHAARSWEAYFDSVQISQVEKTWASQPRIFSPQVNSIPNMPNYEYVRWLFCEVLREPHLMNTYMAARMVRDLEYECTQENFGDIFQSEQSVVTAQVKVKPYNKQDALNHILGIRQSFNHWENERQKMIQARMVRQ